MRNGAANRHRNGSGPQPASLLLLQFREFYSVVIRLRRMVEYAAPVAMAEETAMAAAAGGGTALAVDTVTATQTHPAVAGVWQELLSMLERQALEAGQGGAFAYEVYREAQYVMAALADEIFLHLAWEGRTEWPLLESRLFQTHVAGEEVFNRIERLLQRRDPFYLDLAAVYFHALALGFQGMYRDSDGRERDAYRRRLFKTIYRHDPQLFTASAPLFPQAAKFTLDKGEYRRLPSQRIWLWSIVLVLVLWLTASQLAWRSASSRVSCLICQALDRNCACDAGTGN